jgi:SulP family sulfate permease
MCHGCGGLTAHCRFGATSNRSGYIIGLMLITLALLFGSSALSIVSAFPVGILGVLLCYVGIQHSLFIRDITDDKTALCIALTVAATGFLTHNLTIGFLAGLAIHYSLFVMTKTKSYFAR